MLLDQTQFRRWLEKHSSTCGLRVHVQLRFGKDDDELQRDKSESLNAQHRALVRARVLSNCRRHPAPCRCGLHHSAEETDEEEESDGFEHSHGSDSDDIGSDMGHSDLEDSEDEHRIDFFPEY